MTMDKGFRKLIDYTEGKIGTSNIKDTADPMLLYRLGVTFGIRKKAINAGLGVTNSKARDRYLLSSSKAGCADAFYLRARIALHHRKYVEAYTYSYIANQIGLKNAYNKATMNYALGRIEKDEIISKRELETLELSCKQIISKGKKFHETYDLEKGDPLVDVVKDKASKGDIASMRRLGYYYRRQMDDLKEGICFTLGKIYGDTVAEKELSDMQASGRLDGIEAKVKAYANDMVVGINKHLGYGIKGKE